MKGKAARKAAPRASHADFVPASDRRDPVETLERQARTRGSFCCPAGPTGSRSSCRSRRRRLGPRGLRRGQRTHQPRRRRGRPTAAHAGQQRHLPRMAARRRRQRERTGPLPAARSGRIVS